MNTKYRYTIKIHSVENTESLQTIMNTYGKDGFRVIKVEKTDNVIYEGNLTKYTLYLEEKIKKSKK
jgi:hypothetical protein